MSTLKIMMKIYMVYFYVSYVVSLLHCDSVKIRMGLSLKQRMIDGVRPGLQMSMV